MSTSNLLLPVFCAIALAGCQKLKDDGHVKPLADPAPAPAAATPPAPPSEPTAAQLATIEKLQGHTAQVREAIDGKSKQMYLAVRLDHTSQGDIDPYTCLTPSTHDIERIKAGAYGLTCAGGLEEGLENADGEHIEGSSVQDRAIAAAKSAYAQGYTGAEPVKSFTYVRPLRVHHDLATATSEGWSYVPDFRLACSSASDNTVAYLVHTTGEVAETRDGFHGDPKPGSPAYTMTGPRAKVTGYSGHMSCRDVDMYQNFAMKKRMDYLAKLKP